MAIPVPAWFLFNDCILKLGYFMNCRHETEKMGVQPGKRRDSNSVLDSTSQGAWPKDARRNGHILGCSHAKAWFMKYPV